MAFCKSCGAQVEEGAQFCPSCGGPIEGAAPAPGYAPPAPGYAPPAQAAPPANDAEANKGMAILAYILFFVPLIAGAHKTSPFVKFHTNQGTVLFIAVVIFEIIVGIVSGILSAMFITSAVTLSGAVTGLGVYGVLSTILTLLGLIPLILVILGIVNAATGKMKPLPVIGKFTIIK